MYWTDKLTAYSVIIETPDLPLERECQLVQPILIYIRTKLKLKPMDMTSLN
jgi:hypothetical protein